MNNKIYSNKLILLLITINILVFSVMVSGCLQPENDKNDKKRITAKNAFKEAKKIASNKSSKAILEDVTSFDRPKTGGKSPAWSFDYIAPSKNGTYFTFDITIDWEHESEITIGGYVNKSQRTLKPILNWTLDSDEAMEVAKENPKISEFLNEYEDAEIDLMHLDMVEDYSKDDAVWVIKWRSGGLSPKWAEIVINAHTGEVLHVEADN